MKYVFFQKKNLADVLNLWLEEKDQLDYDQERKISLRDIDLDRKVVLI